MLLDFKRKLYRPRVFALHWSIVDFVAFADGKLAKITFTGFTYDEAIKFIQDNFVTM